MQAFAEGCLCSQISRKYLVEQSSLYCETFKPLNSYFCQRDSSSLSTYIASTFPSGRLTVPFTNKGTMSHEVSVVVDIIS